MVTPKYEQREWLQTLASGMCWFPPLQKTLIVAPHPDDESLACGGLIAALREANVDVVVAAVTDGESAYDDGVEIRRIRQAEQQLALKRLGGSAGDIVRFHLPDSGLGRVEQQVREKLLSMIDGSTHVVAPWVHDFHPDHEVCGRAAQEAAKQTGASISFYLFWTFHQGSPSLLKDVELLNMPLTELQQVLKSEAIRCHRSQLIHSSGEPILPENLLWPAHLPFEAYIRP